MYCKSPRCLLVLSALSLLAACHRQAPRPAVERIAVLRFENLGNAPSDDWVGRALSEVIADELQGSTGLAVIASSRIHLIDASLGRRTPFAPGISAELIAARAADATRIVYGDYRASNGTVEIWPTVEDSITGKLTVLTPVSLAAADLLPAATAVAQQLSPHITPYGTQNAQVLRAHVRALEGLGVPGVAEDLQTAIAADPNFGPTYRQLAQFKLEHQDRDGALALLDQALSRGDAIGASERARVQLQASALRNDPAARQQALTALAAADSADPQNWNELAVSAFGRHQYKQAAEAYAKLVAIQPNAADAWNQFGYAAAYSGDLEGAKRALQGYQRLAPGTPNPLDSLGDVHLIVGRLSDAETFYQQSAKLNPAFLAGLDLLKAAMAHLMTGDVAGADALAQPYFEARAAAHDPFVGYRKAQWEWISGRRKQAGLDMEKLANDAAAASSNELAAHAFAELAMWNLMLGNREHAAQIAQKAAGFATASSATQVALARFLSQPQASASEWETRANRLAPDPSQAAIRDTALSNALLFAKEFAAALPILQRMYDSANPTADEGLPVLLAWAKFETGHVDDAAALLRSNPPLGDAGLNWSTPMHFPRIYYLRGAVAQKQGKADEAHANFTLFEKLSGPDPLMWGEEQKAR